MQLNWPNTLTYLRILAIPLVVLLFYWPAGWSNPAAAWLFTLAAITDWLDGYLARRLEQTSSFGAFLDPVADKLIVAAALVLIVQNDPRPYLAIVAAIIIGREITVSALREWMSQVGARSRVAVSWFGKWKTAMQMVGIAMMLYQQPFLGIDVYAIGIVLLYIAAVLTLVSMVDYLRAAWPALRKSA